MILSFEKYHGTGNDFIIIDSNKLSTQLTNKQIAFLCHRRFGIGADGLMLIEKSHEYDFDMKYYNSDGFEGSMCGNGGRCIAAYANKHGFAKNKMIFFAIDGIHEANIEAKKVFLSMNDVNNIDKFEDGYYLNTGSPHFVSFIDDISKFDVYSEGLKIANQKRFAPERTNVNFVEFHENNSKIATFERGVEDETFSCGTGTVASAIALHFSQKTDATTINFLSKGGKLSVSFDVNANIYTNIKLIGSAEFVFKGEINL
ncbi:MAG: diaminopimelate epimerase [Bacteroidales bacterium]|nr:diaminopimelate epimerase [Bacteroidales bacterium]MDD4218100.1 diaminopimelate epimerase [Bacteroidales bacterium]MDY0140391.1 diaminopimelate epimerase [Bacteroidales bacterium]